MSQEQSPYYPPATAQGGAPVPGTPQYQYVTPQPVDPSQQQQYAQYQQQQPETVLQQPYYPAQTPAPVFQQPTEYKEQPAAIYADAHPAQPVVITAGRGDGHGLTGKLHQFHTCCGFIPLHTGAMIIAFSMVIFYGYCGLGLLTVGTFRWNAAYNAILIILGVVYLGVAIVSLVGFVGTYRQDPKYVNIFVTFFVIGSIVWAILEIVQMAIMVVGYADLCADLEPYYSCGFSWAPWIITFLLGLGVQYYFACCLVSYQRELMAKLDGDVEGAQGSRAVEMH